MPDSACRIEAPIRRMRPETGADLLVRETVSEIAHAVGANSPSYFSRRLKRHVGPPLRVPPPRLARVLPD